MLIRFQNKKLSIISSCLLHIVILCIIGLKVNFNNKMEKMGETTLHIPSYLYTEQVVQKNKTQTETKHLQQPIAKEGLEKKVIHEKQQNKTLSAAKPQITTPGQPVSALVALIHTAIQKQQHYPDSALEMEREGRITLMFTLFTDGTIDHLHIVKSSGTESLDQAAIAAVNHAVPFKGTEKYLHTAQNYQVDVVFELT